MDLVEEHFVVLILVVADMVQISDKSGLREGLRAVMRALNTAFRPALPKLPPLAVVLVDRLDRVGVPVSGFDERSVMPLLWLTTTCHLWRMDDYFQLGSSLQLRPGA